MEDILKQLNNKFGQFSALKTNRGKVLEYLGMTSDYQTDCIMRFFCVNVGCFWNFSMIYYQFPLHSSLNIASRNERVP